MNRPAWLQSLDQLIHALQAEQPDQRLTLLPGVIAALQRYSSSTPLDSTRRQQLLSICEQLEPVDKRQRTIVARLAAQIEKLCHDSLVLRLHVDEGWADDVRGWVESLAAADREPWEAFLQHLAAVSPEPPAGQWRVNVDETGLDYLTDGEAAVRACYRLTLDRVPSADWRAKAREHLERLSRERVNDRLMHWLHRVPGSKPGMLARESLNRELLRGLFWLCPELCTAELAQALQRAISWLYENNSPLGEAGVVVLCRMPASVSAAPLTTLRQRVKAESQKQFLDSALTFLAEREGIDRDDLDDEMPTFGFVEFAHFTCELGDVRAELQILPNETTRLTWHNAQNKLVKSVPARVRREFPEQLESLKANAAGVREALAGLALRLEASFLSQRPVPYAEWRQQHIDHPVAGVTGRRLIWQFTSGDEQATAGWHDGQLRTCDGRVLHPPLESQVTLWHPLGAAIEQVVAWRERLGLWQVVQPFKQAHREIYTLTDAERTTRVYSNRFAAHILRQAQFRQLAKIRSWKTDLVGPWDGGEHKSAQRLLPRWRLGAEFWVGGAGDEYQTGYTYVATDQVRFYVLGETEPLALEEIPPLVFSEVLRDVDLFIGVASIGNDPNWLDRGPDQQHRNYWLDFSFGDLSASARTRRDVLARLLPKLKIADRCRLEDRWLIVRGDLRTYKIHLGSGNILMLPNDQYLCIVPKRSVDASQERVLLPFEGDATLSIILSKAILLADDTAIADESIRRQIEG